MRKRLDAKIAQYAERRNYHRWIGLYERPSQSMPPSEEGPLISVVVPVYNTDELWLRAMIESVRGQSYRNWELCLADDCSPNPRVRAVLEEYAAADPRIKVTFRGSNGHISAASNSALELARGDFIALLDHDDELSVRALARVVHEIHENPDVDFIYTDEDKIDAGGVRFDPHFKPDWDPDYFLSLNFASHFAVYRTARIREVGGFRLGFEGSQDYDLLLRVIERTQRIRHIPEILYHWRAIPGSVALASDEKGYAHDRAREAIREHLNRTGRRASVGPTLRVLHRVSDELPSTMPSISVIRHGREKSGGGAPLIAASAETFSVTSPAEIGEAVARSKGEILVFLDARAASLAPGGLVELVRQALRQEVGIVGSRLIDAKGKLLEVGKVVAGGRVLPAMRGLAVGDVGYVGRARLIHGVSAVSWSAMAVRRDVLNELRGFDLADGGDVDLCRLVRELGYRVLVTPDADVVLLGEDGLPERLSCGYAGEDPFYNPNLSLERADFTPAFPPRTLPLAEH